MSKVAVYFQGVMVRLMLVLAPVMCILGGIAMSGMLNRYMKDLDAGSVILGTAAAPAPVSKGGDKRAKLKADSNYVMRSEVICRLVTFKIYVTIQLVPLQIATLFVGIMCFFLVSYTLHCTWVTSEAYSSPSIVLSARSHDNSRIIFDDFREAYYWLRMNTPEV
jgi:dolichyl-diphosphooligosaccharide---protein glycosyltransferase